MAFKKFHHIDSFFRQFNPQYPIILFYGDNYGLISHYLDLYSDLVAKAWDLDLKDPLTTSCLDGAEIQKNPSSVSNELDSRPLIGGKKLVIVKDITNSATILKEIKRAIEKGLENVILILQAGELKSKDALRIAVEKSDYAMALPCFCKAENDYKNLIKQVTNSFAIKIENQIIRELSGALGQNYLIAQKELEKLCLYCLDKGEIQIEDLAIISCANSDLEISTMVDFIITAQSEKFLDAFQNYLKNGKYSGSLLTALNTQFTQLRQMCYEIDTRNQPINDLIDKAKPYIHFKRKPHIKRALSLWKAPRIETALYLIEDSLISSRYNSQNADNIVLYCALKLINICQRANHMRSTSAR